MSTHVHVNRIHGSIHVSSVSTHVHVNTEYMDLVTCACKHRIHGSSVSTHVHVNTEYMDLV